MRAGNVQCSTHVSGVAVRCNKQGVQTAEQLQAAMRRMEDGPLVRLSEANVNSSTPRDRTQ